MSERSFDAKGLWPKLLVTLLAWLIVYLILLGVFAIFGEQLEAQPFPVQLLIVSGVLVVIMANVVMPLLTRAVGGWLNRTSEINPRDDPG